ncbi:hypothetical protein PENTCL1PPCAC_26884 [Pristionchus entomophagus]|uniref:Transcription factor Iwr1 domain-containing protein n=1 Tax=Pristionchus entomophagus TaxID=358040 RepID=A0AAV5UF50_9BILA|nr:hypothetical protein PENTCL1PPCAC_26884 [Pristionchus entomophagus]
MADNIARLSSIPSRLLEENSGLKATPRRGLAEVQSVQSDKKTARTFGGQTVTPTCQALFSKRKTSTILRIYEDPSQADTVSEAVKERTGGMCLLIESDEEIDTCNRDPTKDEESILDGMETKEESLLIEDGMKTKDENLLIERYKWEELTATWDEDAKTIMFGCEEDNLSIYSISSESEDEREQEEQEEDDEGGVSKYFYSPFNVATTYEEQWESLEVSAHDSDTENDYNGRHDDEAADKD